MWHWIIDISLFFCLVYFMIDKLTLLWVRRCYDLIYHLMVRSGGCLVLLDVDNFKQFNDRYGHKMGNEILRQLGLIILTESRFRAFRYGGDEFAVLLPWAAKEKAVQLTERIRARVEGINIDGLKVTITCAVAHYEEAADMLLLQAKKSGNKNSTTVIE